MTYGSLSIFKEFAEIAKTYPSKPAIFFKEGQRFKSTSYGELYELAIRIADLLYSKGLRQGEKTALIIPNQPQWPMCFLAAQSIGAICVPIDINLTAQEMSKLIVHSDAKIVLCPKRIYEALMDFARAEGKPEFILTDAPEFFEIASPLTSKMSRARNDGQEIAAIIYTSGTTDLPKGVMLTQKNLLSNFDSIKKLNITDSEDVFISVLPLHHTYSFMVTCLLPLLEGAQISYPASLNPEEILTCIKETNVNILAGVPQLFSLFHRRIKAKINEIPVIARLFINLVKEIFWLIRKQFKINLNRRLFSRLHQGIGPSLEFMISGGAHLDEVMAKDFFKWGFTILEGYGLTETSPIATFNTPENYRIGSVGRALPDVQIRIINPDECGLGEVALKGPNVMTGYYKLPEETTKALRDGWFFTGDEGYLDKKGYLYVKGRKDEMIVLTSGKKVNPEEIEKHYSLSPCIKEICVFAPQKAAHETEKRLMALVVPDEKYFHERYQVNIEEKIKWELDNLSYRLSAYKRVKGFVISKDALPRTALGKLMRYEIQNRYAGGTGYTIKKKREEETEEDAGLFSSDTYRATLKYLSNRFKRQIGLNDHLELDLGLDSLGRIELLMDLEQFLKIQIPEDKALELFSASTIKELVLRAKGFLPPGEFTQPKEPEFLWADILRQPPPERMLNIIDLMPSILDKMAAFFVIGGLKIFFGIFFLLKVKGKETFPRKGPCIIYANHTSYIDGLVIAASIPLRLAVMTYYVGFREVFLHPLLKNMTRVARLVPMDAVIDLIEALQTCAYLLKNSKIICYFPEGGRSPDGEIVRFKNGIGILAKELNAPLLPVYIEGTSSLLSRRVRFLKPTKLNVTVGKEITSLNAGAKDDSYEVISENLRRELIKLKPTACPSR